MVATPTPGSEDFAAVEVLLGVSPFVFLVGLLCGLVASVCLRPIERRTGVGLVPAGSSRRRGARRAATIGGLGFLLAVALEFVVDVYLDAPVEPLTDPAWSAAFLLSVGGGLAVVTWLPTFREVAAAERRASRYSYATFVGIWTALGTALHALLL